jgi:hypothetical protein
MGNTESSANVHDRSTNTKSGESKVEDHTSDFKRFRIKKKGDTVGKHKDMKVASDWVKNIGMGNDDSTMILDRNYGGDDITHAGLIYYLHYCWANELGACMRPDIVWYTVVSEFAKAVLEKAKEYKHLFTDSDKKTDIIQIVGDDSEIDVDLLVKQIRNVINDKTFIDTVTTPEFPSAPTGAKEAIHYAFASMSTPYFNFMTSRCGISRVDIYGTEDEWTKLSKSIEDLSSYALSGWQGGYMKEYIAEVVKVVDSIRYYTFNTMGCGSILEYKNANAFYNDMFHYGPETKCGSGHDDVNLVFGWARKLYKKSYQRDLQKFNAHINFVPYQNKETGRMFYKACGLVYSKNIDGTLYPHYGFIKAETTNEKYFKKLAGQGKSRDEFNW